MSPILSMIQPSDGGVSDEGRPGDVQPKIPFHFRRHPQNDPVKISVIVPAFNEEKLMGAALQSINAARGALTAAGWESELIVCDNNSTDRTAEVARAAGALVIFEPVNQIARARNAGASIATGEWFIFVDADSHPTAGLFAEVVGQIKTGRVVAGGSIIRLDRSNFQARAVTGLWNAISRITRWAAGSFIFCEAAAFRAIGGFSNEFYASEELDLCKRLKKHGRLHGKKMIILTRHPLVTSARKMHLYTPREFGTVIARAVFSGGRSLKTREACTPWYDGRR
jgi:cellulose synthase/poly-beta-1,6-N-acetylglucosamine synthase-like glycosyltransferase